MSPFQENQFLKYQHHYRYTKHTRRQRVLSGLLVSVALSLVAIIQTGGMP